MSLTCCEVSQNSENRLRAGISRPALSLKRNALWNLVGSGLPLLAAAASIPYTLRCLGDEAFGILALIWALIGYFGLFDLGIGRALTFEVSRLRASDAPEQISPTLRAGLLMTAGAGLLGAFVIFELAPYLASGWLKISPLYQADAQLSFEIAAIGIVPTTVTSGLRGALEGFGRFGASNLNRMFLGLGMFVLPALSVWLHGNQLWMIAFYLVVARLLVLSVAAIQLRQYLMASTLARLRDYVRPLFAYGFWITVTGIVGPLMVYGDRFFVSSAIGAEQLPYYAIPQEALQRLLLIPAAVCGALLPHLVKQPAEYLEVTYRSVRRKVTLIMLIVCFTAAVFAYPALAWWLSSEFAGKSLPILLILAVGIWLNSIALVPYTLLHARGNPKITAQFHLVQLVLYVIAVYWLTKHFGLIGAALAWTGRVSLDLLMLHVAADVHLLDSHTHASIK